MKRRDFLTGMLGGAASFFHIESPANGINIASLNAAHAQQIAQLNSYSQFRNPNIAQERILIIIAQGGLDAMHFCPPYGDPDYLKYRGDLALSNLSAEPFGLPLNEIFAFHPAVSHALMPLYIQEELLVFPTISSPYRGDKHEEARSLMQDGGAMLQYSKSGWLGRALQELANLAPAPISSDLSMLRQERKQVNTRQSGLQQIQDFIPYDHRVFELVKNDKKLANAVQELLSYENGQRNFFSPTHDMGAENDIDAQALVTLADQAADQMAREHGPKLVILSVQGFDSHMGQGRENGVLAMRMAALAEAIRIARQRLDPVWSNSHIMMMSEFGRSIRPNKMGGTDHGLAGLALLLGGRVKGGRVIGEWEGLRKAIRRKTDAILPTLDSRALFKAFLQGSWGFSPQEMSVIFPNSDAVAPLNDLYFN